MSLIRNCLEAFKAMFQARNLGRLSKIMGIGVLSYLFSLVLLFWFRAEILRFLIGDMSSTLNFFLSLCFILLAFIVAGLFALITTAITGSMILENMIIDRLSQKRIAHAQGGNMAFTVLRAIRDESIKLIIIIAASLILMVAGWIPFLSIPVYILTALVFGFETIDLPLAMANRSIGQRFSFACKHPGRVFALGLIYSVCLLIPFAAIAATPYLYLLAVEFIGDKARV